MSRLMLRENRSKPRATGPRPERNEEAWDMGKHLAWEGAHGRLHGVMGIAIDERGNITYFAAGTALDDPLLMRGALRELEDVIAYPDAGDSEQGSAS